MHDKKYWRSQLEKVGKLQEAFYKNVEVRGIDPRASRMLSERSTIWATPPTLELRVHKSLYNPYKKAVKH